MKIKRLNSAHFLVIFLLILALPVVKEWRMLLFGDRVVGEVVGEKQVLSGGGGLYGALEYRSVIEFNYHEQTYRINGPENLRYRNGEKIPLIISPDDMDKIIIATFAGFYIQPRSVILIIVLLIWTAIYSTLVQIQKGTIFRKK